MFYFELLVYFIVGVLFVTYSSYKESPEEVTFPQLLKVITLRSTISCLVMTLSIQIMLFLIGKNDVIAFTIITLVGGISYITLIRVIPDNSFSRSDKNSL